VELVSISAPDALDEYLREHGFGRIAKRLSATGVIDVVGTAAPGIDDIVVLGKVKQLERTDSWDLIVVDGPAAGHAITFLTAARGLLDAVRGGPVRTQATDVLELLGDPARCQVVLVTIAETTPVNEVIETAFALEDQVGVQLGPVVVNGVDTGVELPDPDDAEVIAGLRQGGVSDADADVLLAAARYRRSRRAMERAEIDRLAAELPLAQVHLPAMSVAGLSADDVAALAAALDARVRPDQVRPAPRNRRDRPDARGALEGASVVVCCGSGGVGKTTTAAVLGLEAARAGRRAVVVTIDPARRLADALGLTDGLASTNHTCRRAPRRWAR
jgi:arsenite/tail-anchored protein-transporting ATPase